MLCTPDFNLTSGMYRIINTFSDSAISEQARERLELISKLNKAS